MHFFGSQLLFFSTSHNDITEDIFCRMCPFYINMRSFKLDSLGQWQLGTVVDCAKKERKRIEE